MKPTYSVKLTSPNGMASYLSFKGQTCWSRKTASKHLNDWKARYAGNAELDEN